VSDPFLALLSPPVDDPEYDWAQWAGTGFLMENAHDYEVMARDESLEDEVRARAAVNARAIRAELRPA
jgi:hypothetical protein